MSEIKYEIVKQVGVLSKAASGCASTATSVQGSQRYGELFSIKYHCPSSKSRGKRQRISRNLRYRSWGAQR